MALSSPSAVAAVAAFFGAIRPCTDFLKRLGTTDFAKTAPGDFAAPGAKIKIPVASIAAASSYDADNNNYGTGGTTTLAEMTPSHFLQGYDCSGAVCDEGFDVDRLKQIFSKRAAGAIAAAVQGAVATAIDGTTTSTGVTIPAAANATLADYCGLAGAKSWINGAASVLAVGGADYAKIRALAVGAGIAGDDKLLGNVLGFRDLVLVPQMTDRLAIVPDGSLGFFTRVPQLIAKYDEAGVETDDESGLSVGFFVNGKKDTNTVVVGADLWFGCAVVTANAGATTAGIVNVGTSV